jgi:hypothetical protein
MTIDQATEILYEEASRQGIAMNRNDCESMARRILMIPLMDFSSMKPGTVAQYHRTRYEYGEPKASHADQHDPKILDQSSMTKRS